MLEILYIYRTMVLHFIRLVLHFHFWVNYRVETHLAYNFFLQNCCKKNLKRYVMLDLFSTDGLLLYEKTNHLLTIQTINSKFIATLNSNHFPRLRLRNQLVSWGTINLLPSSQPVNICFIFRPFSPRCEQLNSRMGKF